MDAEYTLHSEALWVKRDYEHWLDFMSHDEDNISRQTAFSILDGYLSEHHGNQTLSFAEIGFGSCIDFIQAFKDWHDEARIVYTGYDITPNFVEWAKRRHPGYDFRLGGFDALVGRSYDIVYARHIFANQAPGLTRPYVHQMLESALSLCQIIWHVVPHDGSDVVHAKSQGAWVNCYRKSDILAIVEDAGFSCDIRPCVCPNTNRKDAIYTMLRGAA